MNQFPTVAAFVNLLFVDGDVLGFPVAMEAVTEYSSRPHRESGRRCLSEIRVYPVERDSI